MSAPRRSYWGIVRGLGGAALVLALVGLAFAPLSRLVFSERLQREVMVQAVPFVMGVAAVILLFIMLVALVARWLHLVIPHRTHRAVEYVLIAGILLGIVYLFQPVHIGPYRYGFGLLLASTLGFILWSHVTPRAARDDLRLPPFALRARLLGGVLGLTAALLVFGMLAVSARPGPPYGLFPRQWSTLPAERQAEVAARAQGEYARLQLPALALYALLPGLVLFFVTREVLTPKPALPPAPPEEAAPDDTGPVAV
jgi:hypothetical protein